jgi:predicted secreted protein
MPEPTRYAYVAHCLLNANAKVDEWAPCAGVHPKLLRLLRDKGYVIRQMPCPELAFAGLNRFWQVRQQYDTPAYRRHCDVLAEPVASLMAQDLAEPGAEVVLIGVDGSPTMGVRFTSSGPDWGGRPDKPGDFDSDTVTGKGIFVDILYGKLKALGLDEPRVTAMTTDMPDGDEATALAEIASALDGAAT